MALRARVSTATASHVINSTRKVTEETRARVFAAIRELNYSGHSIARSLRRGRTSMLGLVVSDIENPFFATLAGHVQRAAEARGFQVIFANSEEQGERERRIVEAMSAQRVDGIILAPVARASAAFLLERRIPTILVNRYFAGLALPHVVVDDRAGAALGFDHLCQLGHRRIAIVHGEMERSTTVDRLAGVRDAARRRNLALDETLLIHVRRSSDVGETELSERLRQPARPTAVLALSNSSLLTAIRSLHASLLRCPDDVSLVGYGVTSPYWIPSSSISMVEHPVSAIAANAIDLLLGQLENERTMASVMLRPSLVIGRSSGPGGLCPRIGSPPR